MKKNTVLVSAFSVTLLIACSGRNKKESAAPSSTAGAVATEMIEYDAIALWFYNINIGGNVKYSLEIQEDLLAELSYIANQLNTDINALIVACIKAQIISSDVFNSCIKQY